MPFYGTGIFFAVQAGAYYYMNRKFKLGVFMHNLIMVGNLALTYAIFMTLHEIYAFKQIDELY